MGMSRPATPNETEQGKAGNRESLGKARLYVNGKLVAEGPMRTQPGKFTLSGDGLCVGYDSGDAVSKEYKSPGKLHGGQDPRSRSHH